MSAFEAKEKLVIPEEFFWPWRQISVLNRWEEVGLYTCQGLWDFPGRPGTKSSKLEEQKKRLNHSWSKNHLETEPDSIQVNRLCAVHVVKALSVGIHPYLLPLFQRFPDVLPPHTLDPEVLELNGHVLVLTWHVGHVHRAHAPLATLPTNCSWAHLRSELKSKKKSNQN